MASTATLLVCVAFAASRAQADVFYCNEVITPGECPIHLNVTGWNTNQAYIRYGNGLQVCERATIRYHAANISFRCGGSPVDSFCDLNLHASQGDELSLYTENATFSNQYTVGKAYMCMNGGCV